MSYGPALGHHLGGAAELFPDFSRREFAVDFGLPAVTGPSFRPPFFTSSHFADVFAEVFVGAALNDTRGENPLGTPLTGAVIVVGDIWYLL
ncbi:hypothetical protein [Paracoccus everestensis]|uniref:hypothetical protein n=1 Tax=Paracoccus everestensis TaxID=2903900 RepID=UPI001F2F8EBB|nr:hypothetical protein [Paracoccus everestensis]